MKKILPIIILVLLIAVVSFIVLDRGEKTKEVDLSKDTRGLEVGESASLLGWLKGKNSAECVLSTAEGSITVKSKGEKVRIDGIPYMFGDDMTSPESGTSLTAGDWIYMWAGDKGTKFNLESMQELTEDDQPQEKEQVSWEDWAQGMQDAETSYECEEKRFSDDIFTPPSDVEFIDWTEWMTGMQELGQELEEGMEAGETMNIEDIEKKLEELNLDELNAKFQE